MVFSTCGFFNIHRGGFFNMPFFIPSTCLFFLQQFQHAGFSSTIFQHHQCRVYTFNMPFFLEQFQHAGFRNSILQHAFFHSFNMPSFIRSSFNMLVFFQHAGFSQQHPFSTCRFYTFNMPFFPRAISTCRIQEHVHFTNTACTAC